MRGLLGCANRKFNFRLLDGRVTSEIDEPHHAPGDRPLRADARQNVEQIILVAQDVFADLGYQASIAEVARRSGLGMGTIYRHFPNKTVLVKRIAIKVMRESLAQVRRALAEEPGSWTVFTRVVRHMMRLRSGQLFPVSRGRATEPGPELAGIRTELRTALQDLVARTQRAGVMRDDVNAFDVVLMLNLIPPRLPDADDGTRTADPAERYIGVLLDGLRAPGSDILAQPAPGRREIDQFFRTVHGL
ncbi:TetR/AcrR family transcriptional regulator [Streptomyces sp. NEAU-YJ-81]|uniref:TetR/AcrR family transcriptional regulator n=1 Tax=Streptomyces sp. NEAU-YJ-81 TaxID=2820288 RepID=UPI001ABC7A84|nr:TetR/AcrR family transcriptional regulator [Streptomyces sp. NEAU-YJ-81]MBO3682787.1 TetR/AcrR family transcriptional regulator [Streptomyces sp. NEAU-YJ-81]